MFFDRFAFLSVEFGTILPYNRITENDKEESPLKKIVILNGAGKRSGNTASLIKAFTEGAENAGNEVREFYLQTMNIRGCMDCHGCARKTKGDKQPCVQKDDMQQIYDAYLDCDVVVFAHLFTGSRSQDSSKPLLTDYMLFSAITALMSVKRIPYSL